MILQCPACKSRYRIDESQTDKAVVRVKCPKCSHGFEVEIVAEPAASSSAALATDSATASSPTSGGIVIVDDAKFFRELIVDILQPLTLPLQLAGSAEEGFPLIGRQRPQLVILDLKLPGKSGYDLIRQIRAEAALAGIKILAMSSLLRQDEEIFKVLQAGADDFLNKSFKPEHLLRRVEQLLS